jgi:hypothetical protein
MASPGFAFVPRNVSKIRKNHGTSAHVPSSLGCDPALAKRESSYPGPSVFDKGKGKAPEPLPSVKQAFSEEDISILVVLAFSDYALWIDSDLRRKTEESIQREEHDAGCTFRSFLTHPQARFMYLHSFASQLPHPSRVPPRELGS